MKKILTLVLALLFVFSAVSCGAEEKAESTPNEVKQESNVGTRIMLNGKPVYLVAYNIHDNNYFKLRDVANALRGAEAEFDVKWIESEGTIELLSNTAYSTNEEITSEILKNPTATSSTVSMKKDGAVILMNAYNIAGNNFIKLRDIASAINFNVDWSAKDGIIVDTTKAYIYPDAPSGEFSLNTKYLSLMGKTKAQIEALTGSGKYNPEFGIVEYGAVSVGYGTRGTHDIPTDNLTAVSMYIPFENLFFNCPNTLDVSLIKRTFVSWEESYNEMDDEFTLLANYCGKVLMFTTSYGLTKDSTAFINIWNDYQNPKVETVKIINSADESTQEAELSKKVVGYFEDDETQSYMTITFDGTNYHIDPYIVRNMTGPTGLTKVNNTTFSFMDFENTEWVIEFYDDYKKIKLDHPSTSVHRQPDPYWYFVKR